MNQSYTQQRSPSRGSSLTPKRNEPQNTKERLDYTRSGPSSRTTNPDYTRSEVKTTKPKRMKSPPNSDDYTRSDGAGETLIKSVIANLTKTNQKSTCHSKESFDYTKSGCSERGASTSDYKWSGTSKPKTKIPTLNGTTLRPFNGNGNAHFGPNEQTLNSSPKKETCRTDSNNINSEMGALLWAAVVELEAISRSMSSEEALRILSRDRKLEIAEQINDIAEFMKQVVVNHLKVNPANLNMEEKAKQHRNDSQLDEFARSATAKAADTRQKPLSYKEENPRDDRKNQSDGSAQQVDRALPDRAEQAEKSDINLGTQNQIKPFEQIGKCISMLNQLAGILGDEDTVSLPFETKDSIINTITKIGGIFTSCSAKIEPRCSSAPLKVVAEKLDKLAEILRSSINYLHKSKRLEAAQVIRNLITATNGWLNKTNYKSVPLESVRESKIKNTEDRIKNSSKPTNKQGILLNNDEMVIPFRNLSKEDRVAYYKHLKISSEQFGEMENFPKFNIGRKPLNPAKLGGLNRMVTVQFDSPTEYRTMCDKLEKNRLLMNGSLNIEKISCNKNGKSTIICETEAQKETLKEALSSMELEAENAKIKNFSFAIFGILKAKNSEDIVSELSRRDKKRFKKGEFEISERFPISKSKDAVVLSCKESMRSSIIRNPYVFLGIKRHKLNNFIELIQCYKCSKFGHKTNCCTEKTLSCPNCAEKHSLKDCKMNFSPKCSNCSRLSSAKENRHSSWDVRCPYRRIWIEENKNYANG